MIYRMIINIIPLLFKKMIDKWKVILTFYLPQCLSPFWKENDLWSQREKLWAPLHFLPTYFLPYETEKKWHFFFFSFPYLISILPKTPPTNHNLNEKPWIFNIWLNLSQLDPTLLYSYSKFCWMGAIAIVFYKNLGVYFWIVHLIFYQKVV